MVTNTILAERSFTPKGLELGGSGAEGGIVLEGVAQFVDDMGKPLTNAAWKVLRQLTEGG